jgi:hypothetical protein
VDDRGADGLRLFVALIHYPVYNRRREVVATAITNLDIHDLARASHTYGAEGVLIVTPLERQRWLLDRILSHWKEGYGAEAHPNRREALAGVHASGSLEEAMGWVAGRCGGPPVVIATTARRWPQAVGYGELRGVFSRRRGDYILLFGTGWGLTDEVIEAADYVLRPILEDAPYNHLSVRSAAAIVLDRLLGDGCSGASAT